MAKSDRKRRGLSERGRRLTRRGFVTTAGAALLAPMGQQFPTVIGKPFTFKATVRDGGTQPGDPMRYLELKFSDSPAAPVVIVGPPQSPFIGFLWSAMRLGLELTVDLTTQLPPSQ